MSSSAAITSRAPEFFGVHGNLSLSVPLSLCPCSLAAPACFASLSLCWTHLLFGVPMSSHVAPLPPVVKGPRYPLSKSPPLRTVFFPHPAFFPQETAFLLGFLQGSKGSVDGLFGHKKPPPDPSRHLSFRRPTGPRATSQRLRFSTALPAAAPLSRCRMRVRPVALAK